MKVVERNSSQQWEELWRGGCSRARSSKGEKLLMNSDKGKSWSVRDGGNCRLCDLDGAGKFGPRLRFSEEFIRSCYVPGHHMI